MKQQDIQEFETGNHCFGEILTVNGKDYEDISMEEAVEFINDMLKNSPNQESLIKEVFETCLDYLEFDPTESTTDTCEQCGDWNSYTKWINPDQD